MPRRKPDQPKLPKSLSEPISVPRIKLPIIFMEVSVEAADKKVQEQLTKQKIYISTQRLKKLADLKNFYGLKSGVENPWQELCLRMACDFIPGFRVVEKKGHGRKKLWNAAVLYLLWYEVEEKIQQNHSALNACRILMVQTLWSDLVKSTTPGNVNPKTLYEWYYKSKSSSLVRFVQSSCQNIPQATKKKEIRREFYDLLRKHLAETNFDMKIVTGK